MIMSKHNLTYAEGDRRSSEGRVGLGIIQWWYKKDDDKKDDDKEEDDKKDDNVHQRIIEQITRINS